MSISHTRPNQQSISSQKEVNLFETESTLIAQYITDLIKNANISEEINQEAKLLQEQTQDKVKQEIENQQQQVSSTVVCVDVLMLQKKQKKNEKIEKMLKEQQLREAQKQKEQLQEKLKSVEQNINQLNDEKQTKLIPPSVQPKSTKNSTMEAFSGDDNQKKVKLFIKERRQREFVRQQQQLLIQQRIDQEEKQKQNEQQMKKYETLKLRHEQIESHLQELHKTQHDRIEQTQKENQKVKEVLQKKPLYIELQQKFEQQNQITLEEKKKKLAEIRNLSKPVTQDEIKQHQQKYEEQKQQHKQLNEKGDKFVYKIPYQSEAYKKILEEEKQSKQPQPDTRKKQLEVMKEYEKSLERPKVDQNKKTDLEMQIQKIKHRPNFKWYLKDKDLQSDNQQPLNSSLDQNRLDANPKKLGDDYLKQLRVQISARYQRNSSPKSNQNQTVNSMQRQQLIDAKGMHGKSLQKLTSSSYKSQAVLKRDYLKEMRLANNLSNNNINNGEDQKKVANNWLKHLQNNNLTEYQRAEKVLQEAEKLEEQARRKELLSKVRPQNQVKAQEDEEIDQCYINAIKAKLALLDKEQQQQKKN